MGIPGNNLRDNLFMTPEKGEPKELDNSPEGMGGICNHDFITTHIGAKEYVTRCWKCGVDKP